MAGREGSRAPLEGTPAGSAQFPLMFVAGAAGRKSGHGIVGTEAEMAEGRRRPQPGDLIEIDRQLFQHWVIYVGNGYVIHVTDEGDSSVLGSSASVASRTAKVKKERLVKVVKSDACCVNNKYDRSHKPLPVKEIIQSAEQWVGKDWQYNLLNNNCEHFVTMLRYGVALSGQVKDAVDGTTTAAGVLAGLAGAATLAAVALSQAASRR